MTASERVIAVPELTDPDRLAAYLDALANWRVRGYLELRLTEVAEEYLEDQLQIRNFDDLFEAMFEYVSMGGKIHEVVETRPEWVRRWEFHHDLRFEINGRRVYIETRLEYRVPVRPDESFILVVNIHDV